MRRPTETSRTLQGRIAALLLVFPVLLALGATDTLARKGGGKPGGGGPGAPAIACVKEKQANFGQMQGTSYIVVMDADGANETVVLQRRVDNAAPAQFLHPSWSPDGGQLAYTTTSGGLWTVDLDGQNEVCLRTGSELVPAGDGNPPRWSPDGNRLAYTSGDDIWTIDVDGTNEINLTATQDYKEGLAAWASDGRLAYVLWRGPVRYGDADVVVYDGGVSTNASAGGALSGAQILGISWGRTQDKIAVAAALPTGGQPAYGVPDIWIIDLTDPTNPTRATNTPAVAEVFPSWSSDDGRVAYVADTDGLNLQFASGDIYSMNPNGSDATLVAAHESGGKHSIWYRTPDWRR